MSRDLFGFDVVDGPLKGTVELTLFCHEEGCTPAAWLLSETGRRADAQFAPRSQVTRGEGREVDVFTMPAWLAKDRGWA